MLLPASKPPFDLARLSTFLSLANPFPLAEDDSLVAFKSWYWYRVGSCCSRWSSKTKGLENMKACSIEARLSDVTG